MSTAKKVLYAVLAVLLIVIALAYYCNYYYQFLLFYPAFDESKLIEVEDTAPLEGRMLTDPDAAPQRFQRRLDRLNRACEIGYERGVWAREDAVKRATEWLPHDNLAVAPGRDFLVCVVPKCGSNTWHQIAYGMNQPDTKVPYSNTVRNKNNQMALDLAPERGRCLLQGAGVFRGIAVKHPFRRLISAWHQKLKRGDMYTLYLLEAFPRMRDYVSERDPDHVIGFEDAMRYVARYGADPHNLDYHFLSYEFLCKPCLYPYNHLVKMEAMDRDEPYLVQRLGIEKMPTDGKGVRYATSKDDDPGVVIDTYFQRLDRATVQQLMRVYHYDFAVTGYTFDLDTMTSGGFYN